MRFAFSAVALAGLLTGCAMFDSTGGPRAKATLEPSKDSSVKGSATFTQRTRSKSRQNVSGLKPNQEHGFHIHESDCSSGDGMSAGGH
jgi:Cu-Zn family superoxide dismutase